ncbi:hypothetical protein DSL72_005376 [Monilinia vaccinii-corymbosi]|uniref:Uncharacterized protein n=1 Tax=Monilinia vaccinii-corymbosi TaxID=61207 RepID=A0A8A3PFI2_9HELO|nr:hypothetical protein DSL72_005376 [Monilinia vaccinii-corymbosi]
MHSPTANSLMDLQSQLAYTLQPASPTYTPLTTLQKTTTQASESKRSKQFTKSKVSRKGKYLEASQRPLAYTSFSDYGLPEPEGPNSLESTREENQPPPPSPPTTLERIKSVLYFELTQK